MLSFETKCTVLSEFWVAYRLHEDFIDFVGHNDIGLPLAYFFDEALISELTKSGKTYIIQSFKMFIEALEISESEIESLETINLVSILVKSKENREENLANKSTEIDYREWHSAFKPIKNHLEEETSFNGELFGIVGDDLEFVEDMDECFVWTYHSNDVGFYVTNGRNSDSVAGYFITSKRWAMGERIRVTL